MASVAGKVNGANPLISVIVPVYKVESYLHKCVDSIINQTYTNLEIILIDDGSPDSCPAICDEYATKDSRIKVIHKKNGGGARARNAGLSVYTGDYVMFVDSDDWLADSYIMSMINSIGNNDWVIAGVTYVKCGCFTRVEPKENLIELVRSSLMGYACNKMYKRKLIKDFETESMRSVDFIYNLHILEKSEHFSITQDTGYFYLQHNDSEIHAYHQNDVERTKAFFKALSEEINKICLLKFQKESIINIVIYAALSDCLSKIVASNMSPTEKDTNCNALLEHPSLRNGIKLKYANNKLYIMTAMALRAKSGKLFRILYETCLRYKDKYKL